MISCSIYFLLKWFEYEILFIYLFLQTRASLKSLNGECSHDLVFALNWKLLGRGHIQWLSRPVPLSNNQSIDSQRHQ